jgi:hypothetical protein
MASVLHGSAQRKPLRAHDRSGGRQLEAAKRVRATSVGVFLSSSQNAAELLETSRQIAKARWRVV